MTLRLLLLLAFVPTLLCADDPAIRELLFDPVDPARDRTVPVKVYLPGAEAPAPIVLFSHGLGGSRNNNPYLGFHWATNGYVVVFLQHAGSDEEVWRKAAPRERLVALKDAASLQSSLARFEDVPFVIDQLERWNVEEGHPLRGRLDLEHIGMSGHSYGAVTTQAMMGQKYPLGRSFHDPRLSAFLAMSPSLPKRMTPEETFGQVEAPVLLMTGTEDGSPIDPTTTPESRARVFPALPPGDKYQLVLEGAHHHAFGEGGRRDPLPRVEHHHPAILAISTRFWDAYLRDDETAKGWLRSDAPRETGILVEEDVWEWK